MAGVQGYSGIDFHGSMSIQISGRLKTQFTVARAPIPTIVSNSTYNLETSYSAEADYAVNSRVSLKIGGTQSTDVYQGAGIVSGLQEDIQRESLWTVTGTAHFQVGRRLAVEIWATHQARAADISVYDYDDNRVGLSVSAAI